MINMPILRPVPIQTKNCNWFKAIYRWFTNIRKWEVMETWKYRLKNGKLVYVPKGFVFDGASVPKMFWGILSPTGLLLVPGLLHDYAYRYDYLQCNWKNKLVPCLEHKGQRYWDKMFYEEAVRVNGFKIINWFAWLALRCFGFMAWRSNRKKEA